jgi:hypothetical protein
MNDNAQLLADWRSGPHPTREYLYLLRRRHELVRIMYFGSRAGCLGMI